MSRGGNYISASAVRPDRSALLPRSPTAPCVALALAWLLATGELAAGTTPPLPPPPSVRPCGAGALPDPEEFGDLARYRAANARMGPPRPGERRVVFFGDSITELWPLQSYFPGKGYINRGISGQTTAQMLVRFRQDVIDLRPRVVVILAGTNDLAIDSGPHALPNIESHLTSLVQLARANGISVILCSILPVHDYNAPGGQVLLFRPPEKIRAINRWMKERATIDGYVYLDYHDPMVGERGLLKRHLANDGLHPNKAGYAVMAPLARTTLDRTLAEPPPR